MFFITKLFIQVDIQEGDYIISPDSWFYCKTNLYGKGLEVVDIILGQIGHNKNMMSELRAYDVGHLLDVDNKSLGWAPSIMHHLFLCQIFINDLIGVWFKEVQTVFASMSMTFV